MAIVLKKQKSLYLSASRWIVFAFAVAIIGRLLLPVHVFITIATMIAFPALLWRSMSFLVGAIGEDLVSKELQKLSDDYFIINDLCLPDAQIDHVLIGLKGIFTIETKTYIGKIYGSSNDKYWKQYLNGVSRKFYSPVKQGRSHSVKLSELLNRQGINHWINTIVVFAGSATLKKVYSKDVPVIYRKQLINYLYRQPDSLSRNQILAYKDAIMNLL